MKFLFAVAITIGLLTGCSSQNQPFDQAMALRSKLIAADKCSFEAVITADYAESVYTFQMDCIFDSAKTLSFTVTDPESISGITGTITSGSSSLTFDNSVLAFPKLANDQLTPVSTPWILMNALHSGYLTGCSKEDDGYCIYIDDSYEDRPMHLELYTDNNMTPIRAEIICNGRRILSADIRDFTVQ